MTEELSSARPEAVPQLVLCPHFLLNSGFCVVLCLGAYCYIVL